MSSRGSIIARKKSLRAIQQRLQQKSSLPSEDQAITELRRKIEGEEWERAAATGLDLNNDGTVFSVCLATAFRMAARREAKT